MTCYEAMVGGKVREGGKRKGRLGVVEGRRGRGARARERDGMKVWADTGRGRANGANGGY